MPKPRPATSDASATERRARRARNSGKANIRPKRAGLADQVTSMRRAPSAARTSVAAADQRPPGTRTSDANQTGTEPSIEDAADADEEQQAVGHRVEDLAERRHLVEVAGDVAVDPVGGAERRQQPGRGRPVLPAEEQPEEHAGCRPAGPA